MEFLDAVILGLIQGVTEFLPISTSGHVILVEQWLATDVINVLAYDAILHFATAIAVMIYFRSELWMMVQVMLRKFGRLPVNQRDVTLFYALAVGTIPAVLLGILLEGFVVEYTKSVGLMAVMLLLSSIFLMYVEWQYYLRSSHETVSTKRGFVIGFFQALSLLPGFSRAGSTIAGGMLLGMSRLEATRFSFMLAIPITLGVGSKKLIDLIQADGVIIWTPVLVGAGVAFFTSLLVVHVFLGYIREHTLWPFIWYGVILSALVGYMAFIA